MPIGFLTALVTAAFAGRVPMAVPGLYALLSVACLMLYHHDKGKARGHHRRVPESALHALELFGGWPGAWLGQCLFRHKNRKVSYQIVFWAIVVFHLSIWGWFLIR